VLFLGEERPAPPPELDAALRREVRAALALGDFQGKRGQSQLVPTRGGAAARLLLIGLGKAAALERETLRRAAGQAGKQLAALNLASAAVWVPALAAPSLAERIGETLAEGMLLGGYSFRPYKKKNADAGNKSELAGVTLLDPARATSAASMERGIVRGEAICHARDLGNHPGNVMTPLRLAEEAAAIAKRRRLKLTVLERPQLERLGLGLLLGVAKGSRLPPRLILLEYRPKGARGTLAFVGKGITFDSGGISLKPGQAMDEMKFDMCGAAAVLAGLDAIAQSGARVNVVGIVPACENLPGGDAVKPGDILKSYQGTHVEILNTDAEGRLILADALAYGIERYAPDAVIDLATLTGACVVALGHFATGAVSNDEPLLERVVAAGKRSGDAVWPLPNFPEYEELLKGKYADLQNIGPREGGAITAGLFLKQFVGSVPWVHLDIAGTAWGVKGIGHVPDEGATGVGVALLLELADRWNADPR
jgi:leucyl aminopeptidase